MDKALSSEAALRIMYLLWSLLIALWPIPSLHAQTSDKVIVPGDRIGELKLGENITYFREQFKTDSSRFPGLWDGTTAHEWSSFGLLAVADDTTGNILWIAIHRSGSIPWSEYSTREGIRMASSEEEVLRMMGKPSGTFVDARGKSIYFEEKGIRFFILDGLVSEIRIVWPARTLDDTTVLPGKRISNVELGANIQQVISVLGGGFLQLQAKDLPDVTVRFWPHLGLRLRK